jgi:hypothetical protein
VCVRREESGQQARLVANGIFELVTPMCARGQNYDCHQIVTKTGAKQAKISKLQKTEIIAILQLAKGFS